MILSEYNICHYLLDKGMIGAESIVAGHYSARRNDSRNNNFIINKEYDSNNYFIKQVKATDQEKIDTLRAEAACYRLAQEHAQYAVLKKFMPAFFYFDQLHHILVVEEIKNCISLNDYYISSGNFALTVPKKIAELLASYHTAIVQKSPDNTALNFFRRQQPWVLNIHQGNPAQWAGAAQTAEQQAMQLIFKNTEFIQLLSKQAALWQASSLIHNDVKFTNFLADYSSPEKGVQHIKLIDWELADIGDPLWDVASVLQSYIMMWVTTDIPAQQQYPGFRKVNLPEVQPSIKAFWNEYCGLMKTDSRNNTVLEKTVSFAALKLLHSCFEFTPHTPTLQPMSVRLIQMAYNILKSPATAAVQLFGIQ